MNKIILTGGPGTGKSSIILALEQFGEYTVREVAEDYIRLRQAQGQMEPWTESDFQDRILDLQIQREKRIPIGIERVILDRGVVDGLAYAIPGTKIYKRLEREAEKRRYDKILLIEHLGITETNDVRRENHEESVKLGEKLEQIYKNLGYEVTRIKPGPLDKRVKKVMIEI